MIHSFRFAVNYHLFYWNLSHKQMVVLIYDNYLISFTLGYSISTKATTACSQYRRGVSIQYGTIAYCIFEFRYIANM